MKVSQLRSPVAIGQARWARSLLTVLIQGLISLSAAPSLDRITCTKLVLQAALVSHLLHGHILKIFIVIFIGCQCWREVDKQLDAGASWEFHWVLYLAFESFALLMHLVANQEKKRFKSPVYFSLLTPGVPDRVCRSADHLLNVLLPPPLHLLPEVWLHQQQAVGCTVSVRLQGSFAMWLQCVSHNPRLCTDAPTLSYPPLNMTNGCAAYCCVDTKSGPSVTAHPEEQCMNHS